MLSYNIYFTRGFKPTQVGSDASIANSNHPSRSEKHTSQEIALFWYTYSKMETDR